MITSTERGYKQVKSNKMKALAASIAACLLCTTALSGCSSLSNEMITAMNNKTDIYISVEGEPSTAEKAELTWIELDQLTSHKALRKIWDDKLNIIKFDNNSKNGPIYVDTEGNWAGNNTLYNAFQNKTFVKDFWGDSKIKSALAKAAIEEYTDIVNEGTGIIASVNAYYNLMPDNADKTSGLFDHMTRAEVMSAVYRGSNPVRLLEEDTNFASAVGESPYNIYAQNLTQYNYFDINSGSLNQQTYNAVMSRAEAIYLIMHILFDRELSEMTAGSGFGDCKNAGNVADKQKFTGGYAYKTFELEYCLKNRDKGLTEELYKPIELAYNYGIVSSDTKWYEGITGGQLITLLINAYDKAYDENHYMTNASLGANTGEILVKKEEEQVEIIEETFETDVVVQKVKDIADIDALVKVYGDEMDMTEEEIEEARRTAEGFTIEPCDKYMLVDYCYFLNVRVGPGTEFKIKKSVAKGTKVHIVGIVHENGWYRVIADGKIAYQCGVYFSDLEGADTSNMKFEYETDGGNSGVKSTGEGSKMKDTEKKDTDEGEDSTDANDESGTEESGNEETSEMTEEGLF